MNVRFTPAGVCLTLAFAGMTVMARSPQLTVRAAARNPGGKSSPVGRELYMSACAACHGANGTGVPQSRVGWDLPLPDFNDCNFASREPNDDWMAVAHDGGPARGFSKLMPAFGDVLTAEELELVLIHMRTFCASSDWPRGELNLPRALATEKAYPAGSFAAP